MKEDGLSVNLADSGFGLSQTLPIIIECMNMNIKSKEPTDKRSVIHRHQQINQHLSVIEEPEIHLNPKIEAKMGDFFLDIMEDDTGYLIETHSEHIVNRIQRRVAEGTADPDTITVYFVEKEAGETSVREIEVDEDGSFDYWPEGFFQEDFDDAIEMLKSKIEEGKNDN